MKKLRLLPVFLCILTVTLASCDSVDFGDINQDDDVPQEANVEGLLIGGMNQFFTNWGRSYFNNPNLYVQYQAQSTYTTEMTYGENQYPWSLYYSGILSNFKEVYEATTAEEVESGIEVFGHPDNQAAVAEIMSAVVFKRVTDIWGPIPYSNGDGSVGEALRGLDNTTPAYTDQQTIYQNLIERVKAARDMINVGAAGPTGDVLYGGDMEKWQKFANSLLLQLALQLSDVDAEYAEQEFVAALNHDAGVIETVADEAWYDYQNSPGALNPLSQNRGSDYVLADTFTDALEGDTNNDSTLVYSNTTYDERLNVFSSDTSSSGGAYGISGIVNSGASISDPISSAGSDLPYMTAGYTYLNRAEAAERGWTNESAVDMLTTGVMMSYESVDTNWDEEDMLDSDGSDFAAQRLVDATTSAEGGLAQVIAEEKWVALFPMGFNAWSEWRRTNDDVNWGNDRGGDYPYEATGYPGLYPAVDATNGGEIPSRYIYPSAEEGANSQSYQDGVSQLTPAEDNNTSNFWWDVE